MPLPFPQPAQIPFEATLIARPGSILPETAPEDVSAR
jgi:hypothetical protein